MVANIAVVTELERLQHRMKTDDEELARLAMDRQPLSEKLEEARREHQQALAASEKTHEAFDAAQVLMKKHLARETELETRPWSRPSD